MASSPDRYTRCSGPSAVGTSMASSLKMYLPCPSEHRYLSTIILCLKHGADVSEKFFDQEAARSQKLLAKYIPKLCLAQTKVHVITRRFGSRRPHMLLLGQASATRSPLALGLF